MAITKNDELNIASYEQYFGEMELSEKEKKDRIQLAHKFEDAFYFCLQWQYKKMKMQTADYQYIDDKYCQIATKYMDIKETPAYITEYAARATKSIVDTTLNNIDSEYYLSEDRSNASGSQ